MTIVLETGNLSLLIDAKPEKLIILQPEAIPTAQTLGHWQ